MPPKVILTATRGALAPREFVFEERASCIVGRAQGCHPQLPIDDEHKAASRHHCLIDINPPDIRLQDLGSLNGTFLNGQSIGCRAPTEEPDSPQRSKFPEFGLKHGDEIVIAGTALRVSIHMPLCCGSCGKEVTSQENVASQTGVLQCDACRAASAGANAPTNYVAPAGKRCSQCGADARQEIGDLRQGEYVCKKCRNDLKQLILKNLAKARSGAPDLKAIQGYTIERELGRGGMGAVYLARHESSGERVALKVMLPTVAANEHARLLFMREVENTRVLRHKHVVELKDFGCSDGAYFFTMEYCDAGDLANHQQMRGGVLPIEQAVAVTAQILEGLEYAHHAPIPNVRLKDGTYASGSGVVHRDMKPANVLLSRNENSLVAKINDFGLAKAFDTAGLSGLTRMDTVAGTPFFMPRKQVQEFRDAKAEVDVWSSAATLYYLLTGKLARDFSDKPEKYWVDILEKDAVPIRQRLPTIPPRLAEVIDAALLEKPRIGFQSAAEFKRALLGAMQ